MKIVSIRGNLYDGCESDSKKLAIEMGKEYLIQDGFYRNLVDLNAPIIKHIPFIEGGNYRKYKGQSLDGKSLLLIRQGGHGDLLFLTPIIRVLKKQYPACKIGVTCGLHYFVVWKNNSYVDEKIYTPIEYADVERYDYCMHFENSIEASTNPDLHAIDLFASWMNIEIEDYRLDFVLSEGMEEKGGRFLEKANRENKKTVMIQASASAFIRTYPPDLLRELITRLIDLNYYVLVAGGDGDYPGKATIHGSYNLCDFPRNLKNKKLHTLEMNLAIMKNCNLLIAPDSAFTHYAAALEVPTIALYGPFPGKIRTIHYPLCKTLEPPSDACNLMPCMIHSAEPCPKAKMLNQKYPPCFYQLKVSEIIEQVKIVINKP